ncbi:ATP-dependent RNA helicase [Trachipleistophora hominis]|uniref:RNA helicase n=1 Tax=Trachipleistophora hominis TaxID=72359 RepID=L7JWU8_TRAHO|nr:ATP-dependent RNA helicase [Trachipleistophora hominis]
MQQNNTFGKKTINGRENKRGGNTRNGHAVSSARPTNNDDDNNKAVRNEHLNTDKLPNTGSKFDSTTGIKASNDGTKELVNTEFMQNNLSHSEIMRVDGSRTQLGKNYKSGDRNSCIDERVGLRVEERAVRNGTGDGMSGGLGGDRPLRDGGVMSGGLRRDSGKLKSSRNNGKDLKDGNGNDNGSINTNSNGNINNNNEDSIKNNSNTSNSRGRNASINNNNTNNEDIINNSNTNNEDSINNNSNTNNEDSINNSNINNEDSIKNNSNTSNPTGSINNSNTNPTSTNNNSNGSRRNDDRPFHSGRDQYGGDLRSRGRYDRDVRGRGNVIDNENRRKYGRNTDKNGRYYDDRTSYGNRNAVRNTRPYNNAGDGQSDSRRGNVRNVKVNDSCTNDSSIGNKEVHGAEYKKPFAHKDRRDLDSRSETVLSSSVEQRGIETEYGTAEDTSKTESKELIMNKEGVTRNGGNAGETKLDNNVDTNETREDRGSTSSMSTFTSSPTESPSDGLSNKPPEMSHKSRLMKSLFKNLKLAEEKYGIDVLNEYKNVRRSDDVSEFKGVSWDSLGLDGRVVRALDSLGYKYPSPVQKQVLSTSRNNLVVRAKNGTGKTLAYLLPILNNILKAEESKRVKTIILVPTRELAMQVAKVAKRLATHFDKSVVLMPSYGGSNLYEDVIRIKAGIDGIISTPGRILDLIERQVLLLGSVNDVILDEADKLLSLEYKDTLRKILRNINSRRNVYNLRLFSATFPLPVNDFVERNMKNVLFINLMKESCLLALKQYYCCVKTEYKLHCLITLLRKVKYTQTIIFCNRTKTAELLAYRITELGYSCYFLSGKMTQDERNTIFYSFTNLKINILVSTDLTTRGIDVPGINLVINFDWPRTIESYLHRIGRAGRFGTKGISISLVGDDERKEVGRVESALSCELLPVSDPSFNGYCR